MSSERATGVLREQAEITERGRKRILMMAVSAALRFGLGAVLLGVVLATAAQTGWAQMETAIYSFTGGTDGQWPVGGLVQDAQGNLYGTSSYGGSSHCTIGYSCGTVFEISSTGTITVRYQFTGVTDGGGPQGTLVRDGKGNLYGTTYYGGGNRGTVFEVTPTGTETVLYSFSGDADGGYPNGGLVQDAQGNLYGTTSFGGVGCNGNGCGVVFEVTPNRAERVLYAFTGGTDGSVPLWGGLLRDSQGNLYGTTYHGGAAGRGTVFEVTPTGTEKVPFSFTGSKTGLHPVRTTLIQDAQGNLYGTTLGGPQGMGAVFELTPSGTEKVLYAFNKKKGGYYSYGGLVLDAQGNLFGTASQGGTYGFGTVFEITSAHKEKVLYNFTGGADGGNPYAGLVLDAQGNLYGTTEFGGNPACFSAAGSGCGVVFKVTP
jgi:uncharacterized repeat protein (TIGR03803 family)